MKDSILHQLHVVRSITLATAADVPETQLHIIPGGYNNSIFWNLGHILIVQEQLAIHFGNVEPQLPDDYMRYFGQHSSPISWDDAPPPFVDIVSLLQSQTDHIVHCLGNRMDERLRKPFKRNGMSMNTIGELLIYSVYHEGVHIGMINAMMKLLGNSQR
jgi:uncharacterized damage-inducible protein DinB